MGVLAELMRNAASEGVRRLAADSLLSHATAMGRDAEAEAKLAELNAQTDQLMVEGAVRH